MANHKRWQGFWTCLYYWWKMIRKRLKSKAYILAPDLIFWNEFFHFCIMNWIYLHNMGDGKRLWTFIEICQWVEICQVFKLSHGLMIWLRLITFAHPLPSKSRSVALFDTSNQALFSGCNGQCLERLWRWFRLLQLQLTEFSKYSLPIDG